VSGLATEDDIWEDHRWFPKGMFSRSGKSNFSVIQIIKNPIQLLFFVLIGATILLLYPLTHFGVLNYIQWSNAAPSGYQYPTIVDL